MADEKSPNTDEIKATDIVFDCPFCSKSLAIDYRGAGLTIPCTDCGKLVEVPIPEGMELQDFDKTSEEQEISIIHLRKALSTAEARIDALQTEIDDLSEGRKDLEDYRGTGRDLFNAILERVGSIEQATRSISDSLGQIANLARKGAGVEAGPSEGGDKAE